MKRTMIGLLTGALLLIGAPAHADGKPCNLKAIRHTAEHVRKAGDPARLALLQARYDRLLSRCSAPPPGR